MRQLTDIQLPLDKWITTVGTATTGLGGVGYAPAKAPLFYAKRNIPRINSQYTNHHVMAKITVLCYWHLCTALEGKY